MLYEEHLHQLIGRATHGGSFLRLVHVPTGIFREHPGPLKGIDQRALLEEWEAQIEAELIKTGQTQFIVANYRVKNTWQR